jgi:tetratricopeptide (TPR) repeat protein
MKRTLSKTALALAMLLAFGAASAGEYAALMKAKKYAEIEKMAGAKLAQEPGNAEAMAAKVDAILAPGGEARLEEALKLAEQCVAANPASALCHLAVGKALGSKAMMGGMMSAMGSAGKIRDSFKKAVELDPKNLDARFSLLQFFTMAPSFMGGGASKAESLIAQTTAFNPEAGKLMVAMVDTLEGRFAKAEAAAIAARPGADQELQDRHEDLYVSIGAQLMGAKKFADAERIAREGLKRYPDSDNFPLMIARTLQEQAKHRDALAFLEPIMAKNPRASIAYRMGQSLQAIGEKPRAIAAYEKALGFKPPLSKKLRPDAEEQLKSLKG